MDGLSGQQRPDRSSEHQQRETWSHDRSVHSVHDSSLTSPTVQDRLQYDRKELCLVQRDVNGTHLSGCALARQNARARDKRRDERGRWGGKRLTVGETRLPTGPTCICRTSSQVAVVMYTFLVTPPGTSLLYIPYQCGCGTLSRISNLKLAA